MIENHLYLTIIILVTICAGLAVCCVWLEIQRVRLIEEKRLIVSNKMSLGVELTDGRQKISQLCSENVGLGRQLVSSREDTEKWRCKYHTERHSNLSLRREVKYWKTQCNRVRVRFGLLKLEPDSTTNTDNKETSNV